MIENTARTHGHHVWPFSLPNGYVEDQEETGQRQLVASDLLPVSMFPADESEWTKAGFTFGAPVDGDPLFRHATLPVGWSRKASDHSTHSAIVDDKGRERVRIFYKAAFYDRRADMTLVKTP